MIAESSQGRRHFVLSHLSNFNEVKVSLRANSEAGRVGGFVPIVNELGKVIGTITDGDLRKIEFEKDVSLNVQAKDIMNQDFIFAEEDKSPFEIADSVIKQLQKRKIANSFPITYIPVLRKNRTLKNLLHISEILPNLEELNRQIIIIGQGFVGLTFAMALVESGKTVWAVEKDIDTFNRIQSGKPNVFEPQLVDILEKNIGRNYQITSGKIEEFIRGPLFCRRIYIIAVGTPHKDSKTDLTQITEAVGIIAPNLEYGDLIVLRSTVPVGTTRSMIGDKIKALNGMQAGIDFHLAYAPERTVEGNAIAETRKLPQLVAGLTSECSRMAMSFFSGFVGSIVPCESLESCELAKLISNSYRDVIFGFANEIASVARNHKIDVNRLIADSNMGYTRNSIPQPSPGVGGPCLTKDTYMIENVTKHSVMMNARKLNEAMPNYVVDLIKNKAEFFGKDILIIGLAFKGYPATNDLRNSPAIEIANLLKSSGFNVRGIDAVAKKIDIENLGIKSYDSKELDFQPTIIGILNNHELNISILKSLIPFLNHKIDKAIFDPWAIINDSDLAETFVLKFNLSKDYILKKKY